MMMGHDEFEGIGEKRRERMKKRGKFELYNLSVVGTR